MKDSTSREARARYQEKQGKQEQDIKGSKRRYAPRASHAIWRWGGAVESRLRLGRREFLGVILIQCTRNHPFMVHAQGRTKNKNSYLLASNEHNMDVAC